MILIVGGGSAGRRHARNMASLGQSIGCFDPRQDRREQTRQEVPDAVLFETFDSALTHASRMTGAVVASPPSFHVDQTLALLDAGVPVLLEKPVSPDLASALRLQQRVRAGAPPVLLGYTYRWWPPLVELRRRVLNEDAGTLRHTRFVMSAHLADWHPWEAYQDFFMASRELGGGALLDESHFIDLMLWMFGPPSAITGAAEHLSSLEITTDDNVDIIAEYPDNFRVTIHLDLFGRPHEKSVTVAGERGTLQCLFDPNVVRASDQPAGWMETPFTCDRNDMFLAAAREFLALAAAGDAARNMTCGIDDGVAALRCVEAVRRSTDTRAAVPLAAIPG